MSEGIRDLIVHRSGHITEIDIALNDLTCIGVWRTT